MLRVGDFVLDGKVEVMQIVKHPVLGLSGVLGVYADSYQDRVTEVVFVPKTLLTLDECEDQLDLF